MVSDNRRFLPSLTALRAFEAASRYKNFTQAADELNVTPSAVSQQIRHLEKWLGIELFHRKSRPIRLTDEGEAYFNWVGESFDLLSQSTRRILDRSARSKISLSTMSSFAANWLVSRLRQFSEQNPLFDVSVSVSDAFIDFDREGIDIAIRYGTGAWRDLSVDLLFNESIYPVCSPSLLESSGPIEGVADLANYTLLHDATDFGWARWLAAVDAEKRGDRYRGVFFSHSHLALQAAIDGQGIAMASDPLVHDALEDGSLVKPFDFSLATEKGYFLVYPKFAEGNPKIVAIRQWLC